MLKTLDFLGKSLHFALGSAYWERLTGRKGSNLLPVIFCCFLRFPAVFCSFLRLQTTYLADQRPNLQKSAKIFDKLPFLPFSLSHLALPDCRACAGCEMLKMLDFIGKSVKLQTPSLLPAPLPKAHYKTQTTERPSVAQDEKSRQQGPCTTTMTTMITARGSKES